MEKEKPYRAFKKLLSRNKNYMSKNHNYESISQIDINSIRHNICNKKNLTTRNNNVDCMDAGTNTNSPKKYKLTPFQKIIRYKETLFNYNRFKIKKMDKNKINLILGNYNLLKKNTHKNKNSSPKDYISKVTSYKIHNNKCNGTKNNLCYVLSKNNDLNIMNISPKQNRRRKISDLKKKVKITLDFCKSNNNSLKVDRNSDRNILSIKAKNEFLLFQQTKDIINKEGFNKYIIKKDNYKILHSYNKKTNSKKGRNYKNNLEKDKYNKVASFATDNESNYKNLTTYKNEDIKKYFQTNKYMLNI